MTALGIFRFVQSNIRAVAASVEDTEQQLAVERLVALVQDELFNLPPPQPVDLGLARASS